MIKSVLFDFDGVLTLDVTGSITIINYIVQVTGINKELFEREYRKYNKDLLYGHKTHEEVWKSICNAINNEISIDILYDSFINTPIDYDMLELVKELKSLGYIMGIITDNKKDRIDVISEHFRFSELFNYIIVSAEIGSGKDSEDIFKRTLKDISVRPDECIFIDNNEKNLIIPKRMGMKDLFYNHEIRDIDKLRVELASNGIGI